MGVINMNNEEILWKKCVDFHGHECGGLAIGYKAALLAQKLLDIKFSEDEEIVCVTENDACGVDAIQVILGCSVGKGNLIFRIRGKQAYVFYNRKNNKSVRLVLIPVTNLNRKESRNYYMEKPSEELFELKVPNFSLPEEARIFKSIKCEKCGEFTSENMIRLENGLELCLDCYKPYRKFY